MQGQVAALALAAAQHGRAHPVLGPQLVVQGEHVSGDVGGHFGPARLGLGRLLGDLGQRRVPRAGQLGGLAGQAAELTTTRDAALKEIGEQAARAEASRAEVAADIPADVITLYDKLRAQQGVGAAMLRGGQCQGCHLSLHTVDLNQIRATPADEVVRCEECRRILVRTAESGL